MERLQNPTLSKGVVKNYKFLIYFSQIELVN